MVQMNVDITKTRYSSLGLSWQIHLPSRLSIFARCTTALLFLTCVSLADDEAIDPFVGTGHFGKTFPGAATPGGMVQLSPDTVTGGDNGSGYRHYHNTIEGFSLTHMSGVGWFGDLGNILVMPTTGPLRVGAGREDKPGRGVSVHL